MTLKRWDYGLREEKCSNVTCWVDWKELNVLRTKFTRQEQQSILRKLFSSWGKRQWDFFWIGSSVPIYDFLSLFCSSWKLNKYMSLLFHYFYTSLNFLTRAYTLCSQAVSKRDGSEHSSANEKKKWVHNLLNLGDSILTQFQEFYQNNVINHNLRKNVFTFQNSCRQWPSRKNETRVLIVCHFSCVRRSFLTFSSLWYFHV